LKHLVFDTETTGLISNSLRPLDKQPRVIELYALLLDDDGWEEVGNFYSLVNPGVAVPEIVTKITGITEEKLRGAPTFGEVFPSFDELVRSADAVVAHNLSYDVAIVDFECARLGKSMRWPARRVCSVESSESIKGYRLNLQALHEHLFGVGFESAHSAEADVRATARCYCELIERGEI
jgi:DNA polymerase-3 subunit alpha